MFPFDSFLQLLPCAAPLFPSNAWHLPSLAVIVPYISTQTYRYNLLGLSVPVYVISGLTTWNRITNQEVAP